MIMKELRLSNKAYRLKPLPIENVGNRYYIFTPLCDYTIEQHNNKFKVTIDQGEHLYFHFKSFKTYDEAVQFIKKDYMEQIENIIEEI